MYPWRDNITIRPAGRSVAALGQACSVPPSSTTTWTAERHQRVGPNDWRPGLHAQRSGPNATGELQRSWPSAGSSPGEPSEPSAGSSPRRAKRAQTGELARPAQWPEGHWRAASPARRVSPARWPNATGERPTRGRLLASQRSAMPCPAQRTGLHDLHQSPVPPMAVCV